MTKKDEYLDIAEKLFVNEYKTLDQIAEIIPVSVRTLAYWKNECFWDRKRLNYVETKRSLHEKLFKTLEEAADDVRLAQKTEEGVNPVAFLNLKRLIEVIDKVQKYESSIEFKEEKKTEQSGGASRVEIVDMIRNELGLNDE